MTWSVLSFWENFSWYLRCVLFKFSSNSKVWIRSTLRLKHALATNSFAPNVACYPTVRIITLRANTLQMWSIIVVDAFIFPPTHYRLDRSYHNVQGALPIHIGRSINQGNAASTHQPHALCFLQALQNTNQLRLEAPLTNCMRRLRAIRCAINQLHAPPVRETVCN